MGQSEKMEEEDNRPKWLLELENRKRKPRLAHEVGAGAPCMTCSDACPGLDLHFWRKICKNCKCSRDDHDVPNDEFPQFDLLFGPTGKPNRKMIVLKVNKKQAEAETTFEWAPPDTTKELAADYMKALPEDKLPIKGSAGAALRKQQLHRQLPLHDIDHKACDELSDFERKQFEKYLENLKKYVGQGKVIKAMGARPFDISLMTPANATDMNRFSPQHKPTPPGPTHTLNLRTPSSFVPKSFGSPHANMDLANGLKNRDTASPARDQSPSSASRLEKVHFPPAATSSRESPLQGRYHHALANVRSPGETLYSKPVTGSRNAPVNFPAGNNLPESSFSNHQSENKPISSILQPYNSPNASIASSEPVGGSYNPAVQFAASNMIDDPSQSVLSRENEAPKPSTMNRVPNNAFPDQITQSSPADAKFLTSGFPGEKLTASSSTPGAYNAGFSSPLKSNQRYHSSGRPLDSGVDKNEEEENSLLADKMLSEALLPPSAIHSSDIIGSTLDKKGLSFIREKLTSKYSAKEDPVSLQNAARARELGGFDKEGAKLKRSDQFRRQGAFDKEAERTDIIAATKNPSGTCLEEGPVGYLGEAVPSSSRKENGREGQHSLAERLNQGNNGYPPNGMNGSRKNIIPGASKETPLLNPRAQVMKDIWANFLARPGQSGEAGAAVQNLNKPGFDRENPSSLPPVNSELSGSQPGCKPLQAELSSYGPGVPNLIRSESLHNPVFPEEPVGMTSGIVQNPVDRLRGAIEELSVCQAKTQSCHQCKESVRSGDVVVTAEKAKDAVWHPGCFVCSVCNELLADLFYFFYKGKLYCGRDMATLLEIPRCFACDELIFVREYTVAEGHNYHIKHFCCWDCDMPLAGQQYTSENDRPLCLLCYQKTYAKTCRTCQSVIAADQQGVSVKNLDFHATEQCFCCATCKKSLLNGKMTIKEERPFCSKECLTRFLDNRPT